MRYDAVVLVSFGGPEGPDDVMPFLRRVSAGRGIPDERLAIVARHYQRFGGVSPINESCRQLLRAARADFAGAGLDLPWYWGNRNWHPLLEQTVAAMRDDGVRRALAFVTSPFGSASSCRQYLEDIDRARAAAGSQAPVIDKIRHYYDHPGYVGPFVDSVRAARHSLSDVDDADLRLVFTAHSIPTTMDDCSGPTGGSYSAQLLQTARLVAAQLNNDRAAGVRWDLAWQSRSGPPGQSWLEPDINDHLVSLAEAGVRGVVVAPIGFISDHMEVVWDLDSEAAATARRCGLRFARAATVAKDPRFITMLRELVVERLDPSAPRARLGALDWWETCPSGCCRAHRP